MFGWGQYCVPYYDVYLVLGLSNSYDISTMLVGVLSLGSPLKLIITVPFNKEGPHELEN